VIVTDVEPEPDTVADEYVAPVGSPRTAKLMVDAKPFIAVTATV
jgi:hypothetical protein